jgi:large subunit ribosomal protein L21
MNTGCKKMFAVIKTGGKQYRVAAGDEICVMSLEGEAGTSILFKEVLMLSGAEATHLGAPLVAGAEVAGEIIRQARGPKVIAFKKRRRKHSQRKRGHRQDLTMIRITGLSLGGRTLATAATAPASASTPA